MVLKLYGFNHSTCTRRVAAVLVEKKVPFEFVAVDIRKGEHKRPEYLRIHPFGQVPYIDDDGFILFESRAICRYVEDKWPNHGTKLVPDDPKAKALFEQAVSIEQNDFEPNASRAVNEKIFKPLFGLKPDEEAFNQFIKDLGAKLDAYEKILSKQKYLAGDNITLADFYHLPYGHSLQPAGSDILTDSSRPNVARWWNDISTRQSWQSVKDGNIKSAA